MNPPSVGKLLDALSACDDEKVLACIRGGVSTQGSKFFVSSPLHYAAHSGQERYVQWLMNAGADLEATNDLKRTPLHSAAAAAELETVAALVTLGARLDVEDVLGYTPRNLAARRQGEQAERVVAFLDAAAMRQTLQSIIRQGTAGHVVSHALHS